MTLDYLSLAQGNQAYTVGIRRHLHEYPELSDKEYQTLIYIMDRLKELEIPYFEVENGGIFATITGQADESERTILLRADIDALPVLECSENLSQQKPCQSKIKGVAHVCGHDAHTAMLLTSAKILQENRAHFSGKVLLMFERGEEGTENLYYLLKYLQQHQVRVDGCYAMHMAPMLPSGQLAINPVDVMAGICAFKITLHGKGGHGSRPDLTANPVACFVDICTQLDSFRLNHISPFDTFTYSICSVEGGSQINTIPQALTFGGTARFYERERVGQVFSTFLKDTCERTAERHGCHITYPLFIESTHALKNNADCVAMAYEAISPVLGAEQLKQIEPLMCTESMADMHMFYPSVYCLLGTRNEQKGTGAELHDARFDVDEDVLPLGVAAELAYVFHFLASDKTPLHASYKEDLDIIFGK